MLFQELKYPRRKNFIKSLNILLDSSPINSPEKALATRMLNYNYSKKNALNCESNSFKLLNSPNKVAQNKRLLSSRTIQNNDLRKYKKICSQSDNFNRDTKSVHQLRRNPLHLFKQKVVQQLISPRKVVTQNSSRTKKSEINMNEQFVGNVEFVMTKSTILAREQSRQSINRVKSIQLKRNSEGVVYDYSPKISPSKEYLKKGTSINKSIMNNIIRMKLSRPFTNSGKGFQTHIQNKEIINLIKLYKGVEVFNSPTKSNIKKSNLIGGSPEKQKDPLYIEGWFNQTQIMDQYQQQI